jgi:hypothetical protein
VALDALPSHDESRPRGPERGLAGGGTLGGKGGALTGGLLGKGALAAQNLSEAVQALSTSDRKLLSAALHYLPHPEARGGGMHGHGHGHGHGTGGGLAGGGKVRASTSHGFRTGR